MKIKICGLKYENNIRGVADLAPDYMGFIFYRNSSRYAAEELTPIQTSGMVENVIKVGVFVNEEFQMIKQICLDFQIDTVQLHGTESPVLCQKLKDFGYSVIKSFGIYDEFDFEELNAYEKHCDFFLFDIKTSTYGGSGKRFEWDLLKQYQLNIPYFLSGGITLNDLDEIKTIKDKNLFAIDVNSRFEIEAGLKDTSKVKILINRIRHEF